GAVGPQLGDGLADLLPRARQVAAAGRQAAGDQHQGVGPQLGGLVDGGAVVVEGTGSAGGVGGGEEAAAAQRGHRQSGVAHQPGGGGQAVFGDRLAPQADAGDAQLDAA